MKLGSFCRLASVRSLVLAAASLAALALQAFDTPYLTFRSASSFSLSATKRWDGTLQKATSNPTDEASWLEWTGTSITAVESGGQYYIYLRGKNNTCLNTATSALFAMDGSNIICEGDIETLRDYEGTPMAMATGCYKAVFRNCTALITPPTLSATVLAEDCYEYMFRGCTSLKSIPALPATGKLPNTCYFYNWLCS